LHGPYWYRLWREWDGKQHKEYVRKSDLERVRAACDVKIGIIILKIIGIEFPRSGVRIGYSDAGG
jgi:hypothetical protein